MCVCGVCVFVCVCGMHLCVVVCECVCVCVCVKLHECISMWTYSIPPLQSLLQQAKEQADEFHKSYKSLDAGLGSVEEAQEKEEPIHSEVEVVKQQLEAHKVRVTASSSIFFFCPSSIPFLP